jgi:hypothetical protein
MELNTRRRFGFFFKNILGVVVWMAVGYAWIQITMALSPTFAAIFVGSSVLLGVFYFAWQDAGHKLELAHMEELRTARSLARE